MFQSFWIICNILEYVRIFAYCGILGIFEHCDYVKYFGRFGTVAWVGPVARVGPVAKVEYVEKVEPAASSATAFVNVTIEAPQRDNRECFVGFVL